VDNIQKVGFAKSPVNALKFRPSELQDLLHKKAGAVEAKARQMIKENASRCVKELIQVPCRWVPPFEADSSIFKQKFSKGRRHDFYKRVQVERFSENNQADNLVKRVSIYADYSRIYLTEVRSYYINRTDNLRLKRDFPFSFKSVESFDPFSSVTSPNSIGNPQWKEIVTVEGHMVVFKYFNTRFVDGLIERTEIIGSKTMNRYENRDDRLEYLSVRFSQVTSEGAPREAYTFQNRHCGTVRIRKMVQKFTRNSRLDDPRQIAKVIFNFESNKIQVTYHPSQDPIKAKLSPSVATFSRDLFTKVNAANGIEGAFTAEIGKQIEKLYQMEKDCLTKVRQSEIEIKEELTFRTSKKTMADCDSPDELRRKFNRALQSSLDHDPSFAELEKTSRQSQLNYECDIEDLLGQELKLRGWVGRSLTITESEEAQAKVLKEIQERFLERMEVMNHRLTEEKAKLEEMKEALINYKKVHKPEEEPAEGLTDKIHQFASRISVLEERLINFKRSTYKQFQDVQESLAKDPRLKIGSMIR
jgi:hypothetical protein